MGFKIGIETPMAPLMARARASRESAPSWLTFQFLAAWVGAWLGRRQQMAIEYLREENRILRAGLGAANGCDWG